MAKHIAESGLFIPPAKGRIYCFVCKLFPNQAFSSALAFDGFDDWHNSYLIQAHENSEKHRNAMLTYLTRAKIYAYFKAVGANKSKTTVLVACNGKNHRCNLHSCRMRLTFYREQ